MPFPLKIQPIDSNTPEGSFRNDPVKPVAKSRFKRLFERQFQSVLRISSSEKVTTGVVEQQSQQQYNHSKDDVLEPSSVCLAKMVQSFIEESNEKPNSKCGKKRCNCFNGNCSDSSDDELDFFGGGFSDSVNSAPCSHDCDCLKSLVSSANVVERNVVADVTKILEANKICKPKDDCRKFVVNGLGDLGYNASICKSRWDKSPQYPAGEYEYIDVIVEGERLIVDIDFRSEFEIARSTKNYRGILQFLPVIFVGKPDRLQQIVSIVSEGAKQSLKKKGMHLPPWRKADYMRAKWLSPFTRTPSTPPTVSQSSGVEAIEVKTTKSPSPSPINSVMSATNFSGEFEMIFGEENKSSRNSPAGSSSASDSGETIIPNSGHEEEEKIRVVVSPWQPPAIKPRSLQRGGKIVTGLASILKDKP